MECNKRPHGENQPTVTKMEINSEAGTLTHNNDKAKDLIIALKHKTELE